MDDTLYEPQTESDYIEAIRDYSRELTGSRDEYGNMNKIGHMDLTQLKDYYEGLKDSPEAQELAAREQELGDIEMGIDNKFDKMPKQAGMGRGLNEEQLKKMIRKEAKRILEARYHFANSFDQLSIGEDPRAQAFEQCIKILNDLTYDSLEDDVASYADEAAQRLWKAAEELDYKRNQVGNISENERRFNEVFGEELDPGRTRITTGEPVGEQEAFDTASFLEKTHGIRLSRMGMDKLIDFLKALESSEDLRRTR